MPGGVWACQSRNRRTTDRLAVISRTTTSQCANQSSLSQKHHHLALVTYQEHTHQSCQSALHLAAIYSSSLYPFSLHSQPPSPQSHSTLEASIHRISDESDVKHRTGDVHTSWLHVVSFTSDRHRRRGRRLTKFEREAAHVLLLC